VALPQDDKHVSNRFRKYLGIAAIVIRDMDGIGFSRAWTQVDLIARTMTLDTDPVGRQNPSLVGLSLGDLRG
jgi:hypothetical protein